MEILALDIADAVLRMPDEIRRPAVSSRDERRVVSVVRHVERQFGEPCSLGDMARLAGLSPYHFLRIFRRVIGLTPHQYLLRNRLRSAAAALVGSDAPVTEVALAAGFGDMSNFARNFHAEYRMTPSSYRARRR
jgi:transcriptional regulator GlxA family with amidase domain